MSDVPPDASSSLAAAPTLRSDLDAVAELATAYNQLVVEIDKRIVGQRKVVELVLVGLFARGHMLLVGVPGLAKTSLVAALAEALHLNYQRIQFTPDLMPSDITGTDIIEQDPVTGRREFRFVPGPLFGNLILADEINRTPPKTQAALLQAMQEHCVTSGGRTYEVPQPFLVLATQNPIEQEGTYPLPEAQLDRFMFQIDVDYPSEAEEFQIVRQHTGEAKRPLTKVLSPLRISELQELVRRVPVADHVVQYAVALARASRPSGPNAAPFVKDYVAWGAGPRAPQFLIAAAKARAILSGRFAVSLDDVVALARPTMQHRMVLNYRAQAEGVRASDLIDRLLSVIVPQ